MGMALTPEQVRLVVRSAQRDLRDGWRRGWHQSRILQRSHFLM